MSRYIQSWKLDRNQTVHLTKCKKIAFRQTTSKCYRGLSISYDSLKEMYDFATMIERHPSKIRIPLDNKVWIQYHNDVKLYVTSPKRQDVEYRFFRFSDVTWRRFIKYVLPDIISCVDDGECRQRDSCESDARS